MKNRNILLALIALILIGIIIGLLAGLKIEYYERIPHDIKDHRVLVILKSRPDSIFLNINNKVYEINKWTNLYDDTFVLDFSISKQNNDKVFCYIETYKLNYLSYIFKIVFNI